MPKVLLKTKGTEDKVASVGDLEWPEVKAILETMAADDTLVLHKLEIRKKNNGTWRTIIRATKAEPKKMENERDKNACGAHGWENDKAVFDYTCDDCMLDPREPSNYDNEDNAKRIQTDTGTAQNPSEVRIPDF